MITPHKFKFLILLLILALSFFWFSKSSEKKEEIKTHTVRFYDEASFNLGVKAAHDTFKEPTYIIKGGIVPHHLAVGFIISDFFKKLSVQDPKTIFLIGPNHFEKGKFMALTSLYNWKTEFGIVEADHLIIKELLASHLLEVDEETLPLDHSLSGLMTYIKYYIPKARVVPILLSSRFSIEDSKTISNSLYKLIKKDAVILASVDFSHYLIGTKAQDRDTLTLKVMKEYNYDKLYSMNNDFLDSPPSIGTLLMTMQKQNAKNFDIQFNTNSGKLQNNNTIPTTSYFSIFYY